MKTVYQARAEIDERFQQDDGGKFWIERFPWVVSYSGGKDSTLLLLLVLDALRRFGQLRPVYVIFSDTMIEQDGIVERVERNFKGVEEWAQKNGLEVKTAIIRPLLQDKFFNHIVGLGYGLPCPPKLRWCVDRLKLKPISNWKRATFGHSPFVMLTGERFDESAKRKASMNSRLDADGYYTDAPTLNERKYTPIRNVLSVDLWRYFQTVDKWSACFPWGEEFDELLEQYNAGTVEEILSEGKERRSGCRFCTFSKLRKGASTDERENAFCRRLAEYGEKNVKARNLIELKLLDSRYNQPKNARRNREILDGNYAIGRMSIKARQEVWDWLKELEEQTGRVWIDDADAAFIAEAWKKDAAKIESGELVDAQKVLKTDF